MVQICRDHVEETHWSCVCFKCRALEPRLFSSLTNSGFAEHADIGGSNINVHAILCMQKLNCKPELSCKDLVGRRLSDSLTDLSDRSLESHECFVTGIKGGWGNPNPLTIYIQCDTMPWYSMEAPILSRFKGQAVGLTGPLRKLHC